MMNYVQNNTITTEEGYKLGGVTGKGFMPGHSGNPGGKPKNPLRDFSLAEFNSWNDKKKREFLAKVSPIDRWKMTEKQPTQEHEHSFDEDAPLNVIIRKWDN